MTVYRRQEEKLKAARDVIRFYLETAEEAVTIDIDAPQGWSIVAGRKEGSEE